jgi:hypothetical protein
MDNGTPNNAAFPRDGLAAFEPQASVRDKRAEGQTFRKRPNCQRWMFAALA